MSTRIYPKSRLLVTIALIGALLFHVQTVFACNMMEVSAKAETCCCDKRATNKALKNIDNTQLNDPCCEFSSEITLNGIESEAKPYISQANNIEYPQPLFVVSLLTFWPPDPISTSTKPSPYQKFDLPLKSNTPPYLATQRLRI